MVTDGSITWKLYEWDQMAADAGLTASCESSTTVLQTAAAKHVGQRFRAAAGLIVDPKG
jgi:hypothetical protein